MGETSFVLIEYNPSGRSTGIAYVGFKDQENNETAVQKFDKKKAVGEVIRVEEIKPLNISIAPKISRRSDMSRVSRGSRGEGRSETRRGGRPKKPTIEELDDELNRYMSNTEESKPPATNPSRFQRRAKPTAEDLDKELDDYMKTDQPFPSTGGLTE